MVVKNGGCRCPAKCDVREGFSGCVRALSIDWSRISRRSTSAGVLQTFFRLAAALFIVGAVGAKWWFDCAGATTPAPDMTKPPAERAAPGGNPVGLCFADLFARFGLWSQVLVVTHLLVGVGRALASNGCSMRMSCGEVAEENRVGWFFLPQWTVLTARGREEASMGKVPEGWSKGSKLSFILFELAFVASLVECAGWFAVVHPTLPAAAVATHEARFFLYAAHAVPCAVMWVDLLVGWNAFAVAHVLFPLLVAAAYVLANYLHVRFLGAGKAVYPGWTWEGGGKDGGVFHQGTVLWSTGIVVASLAAFVVGAVATSIRDGLCTRKGMHAYSRWTPKTDYL